MRTVLPPHLLLDAYRQGIFPMVMKEGSLAWFSPEMRGVIPLEPPHFSHGVLRSIRNKNWKIRCDTCFPEVLSGCAARDETWIDESLTTSYIGLFRAGHAHSVEIFHQGTLAGGLYGVHIGGAFFGESMFHNRSGASKAALAALMGGLREAGFALLDTQWSTAHLTQFGCIEVPRIEYLSLLDEAWKMPLPFPSALIEKQSTLWQGKLSKG